MPQTTLAESKCSLVNSRLLMNTLSDLVKGVFLFRPHLACLSKVMATSSAGLFGTQVPPRGQVTDTLRLYQTMFAIKPLGQPLQHSTIKESLFAYSPWKMSFSLNFLQVSCKIFLTFCPIKMFPFLLTCCTAGFS